MRIMTSFFIVIVSITNCFGQVDSTKVFKADSIESTTTTKPEILTSGFIDVMDNGQVNASARFIRLYIGEKGKFAIPLSFYSGVSSNNFQNQQSINGISNDQLINAFINPLSGLVNVSIDGMLYFNPKSTHITKSGLMYQFGSKVLTGYKQGIINEPETGAPINFLNHFATIGLYFQTGAWERNNAANMGIFWSSLRFINCYSNPSQLTEFLPDIVTNGFYNGYCLGFGIEINNLINMKILYYKYLKAPEIQFKQSIYQFSFNYSLK
jgi:hypothetical protein